MSHSLILSERLRRRAPLRKAIAAAYIIVAAVYLIWRATIINDNAFALSLIYLVAEAIGFILGLMMIFSSWNYRYRPPRPAPAGKLVDVFVTTYREPVELVRWTLLAAKEITYPHQTFLLDDGNRPEMKALAEELGIRYLAREHNVGAKAGNLNNGLKYSTAEFVFVLDADQIPQPHALDVTLGHFDDPHVALVQTPQDYYNVDAFQYVVSRAGALWHDQSFYAQIRQPRYDVYGLAFCVGSAVLYRRAALDAIGGIPIDTVTEDFHTTLKLQRLGYTTAYLPDSVAYGVAAVDLGEYYKTRHRWNHGNLHGLRLERAVLGRGLTLKQRLSNFTHYLVNLDSWHRLLLAIVPIGSLLLGWAPFVITPLNVVLVLAYPLFGIFVLHEIGCGFSRIWAGEVFGMARLPVALASWAALFGKKLAFRTSSKSFRGRIEWRLLTPQLAIGGISLAATVYGAVRLALDFKIGPLGHAFAHIAEGDLGAVDWHERMAQGYTLELVVIAGFWALLNALKILGLIVKVVRDARHAETDCRFGLRLPFEAASPHGKILSRVTSVSLSSLSLSLYDNVALTPGTRLSGRLFLPAGTVAVEGIIVGRRGTALTCRLVWIEPCQRENLARALFSVDWYREFMHRSAYFETPLERLGRRMSGRGTILGWSPALYRADGDRGPFCAILGMVGHRGEGALIAFRELRPGDIVELCCFEEAGVVQRFVRVTAADVAHTLASKGFDGAILRRYCVAVAPTTTELRPLILPVPSDQRASPALAAIGDPV